MEQQEVMKAMTAPIFTNVLKEAHKSGRVGSVCPVYIFYNFFLIIKWWSTYIIIGPPIARSIFAIPIDILGVGF